MSYKLFSISFVNVPKTPAMGVRVSGDIQAPGPMLKSAQSLSLPVVKGSLRPSADRPTGGKFPRNK
jgi:hypothetical protein